MHSLKTPCSSAEWNNPVNAALSAFVYFVSVEIATLTRENGKTCIKVLKQKEVEELIKKHEAEEAKAEKDKKEKEQKEKDK